MLTYYLLFNANGRVNTHAAEYVVVVNKLSEEIHMVIAKTKNTHVQCIYVLVVQVGQTKSS